jgi:hypothetical protein
MPSFLHEALVHLFRTRPVLAAELLEQALHVKLPSYSEARVEAGDLTHLAPAELRADLVVQLVQGSAVLGIIVEVQLRADRRKRFAWPCYVTGLRARLECPCVLLVFCPKPAVARWASAPIDLGGGSAIRAQVIGPDGIPVIRAPAPSAELAVLSALAHGRGPVHTAVEVALAAAGATEGLPADERMLYSDLVFAALSEAARKELQMLPKGYQFQSEPLRESFNRGKVEGLAAGKAEGLAAGKVEGLAAGKAEGLAAGKAEGLAAALLGVLEARGLQVLPEQRERIRRCADLELLLNWTRRAITVSSTADLFECGER